MFLGHGPVCILCQADEKRLKTEVITLQNSLENLKPVPSLIQCQDSTSTKLGSQQNVTASLP